MTSRHPRRILPAHRLLFPLAAAFALGAVPLWLALRGAHSGPDGALWHGHEMLFGFALAVIAGFLATRPMRAGARLLGATWCLARVAALAGGGWTALVAGLAFPMAVFSIAAPPLFAAAKRRENLFPPVILAILAATDAAWWTGTAWQNSRLQTAALLAALDVISLLLLLIGGRALRAAVGGHLERLGIPRRDFRQRGYELPLAALTIGAALCDALSLSAPAGVLCLGAAVLTGVRVLPWQLHRTLSRPPLWSLALGYLWLVPGLALKGLAQFAGGLPVTGMLHGIGMGALGTLTLVMMARTALLRAHRPIADFGDIGVAALLVSAAALARLVAAVLPSVQSTLLWLAAAAWSGAFLILLVRLLGTRRRTQVEAPII